jgi:hypothetical protein
MKTLCFAPVGAAKIFSDVVAWIYILTSSVCEPWSPQVLVTTWYQMTFNFSSTSGSVVESPLGFILHFHGD